MIVFQSFDRMENEKWTSLFIVFLNLLFLGVISEHPWTGACYVVTVAILCLTMHGRSVYYVVLHHIRTLLSIIGAGIVVSFPGGATQCGLNKRGSLSIQSKQLGCFHHMGVKLNRNNDNSGSIVNVLSGWPPWLLVSKGKLIH